MTSSSRSFLHEIINELKVPFLWGSALLLLFAVRDFFMVIFLTFLLTYTMRSVVLFILKRCVGFKDIPRIWEIVTVIACFLTFLTSLYGIGSFMGPQLVHQGQNLVKKLSSSETNPSKIVDHLLARTVGEYLVRQKYGDRNSLSYQRALSDFSDPSRAAAEFENTIRNVSESFDISLKSDQVLGDVLIFSLSQSEEVLFRQWVYKEKSAIILETDREKYRRDWSYIYKTDEFKFPGLRAFDSLSAEERNEGVLHFVTNLVLDDNRLRSELIKEWRKVLVQDDAHRLKEDNPEEYERRFEEFYLQYHIENPLSAPYSAEVFQELRQARKISPEAFAKALSKTYPRGMVNTEAPLDPGVAAFENAERLSLVQEWKKGALAEKLQKQFEEQVVHWMSKVGSILGELLPVLFAFPVQLLLILLLSFLISIDIPRMARGLEKIRLSRARWIYEEFAPFLISFGKLIGRAFQAQGLIAVVNSILTLIAIQLLGIENAAFFCGIVFLCSFIPVLGVVLSSAPIAIMALVQEGGGLMIALTAIGAILFIHFIETSLLNPKILGDMLHLHPVLVLVILAICEHFFGVWGLLLGVPVIVYIIRFIILGEGIPGFIEPISVKSGTDLDY
jgi:predicted PurR-regulated permease PerM